MPLVEDEIERVRRLYGPPVVIGESQVLYKDGSVIFTDSAGTRVRHPDPDPLRALPRQLQWCRLRMRDLEVPWSRWRHAGFNRYVYVWDTHLLGPGPTADHELIGEARDAALHKAQGERLRQLYDEAASRLSRLKATLDPMNRY